MKLRTPGAATALLVSAALWVNAGSVLAKSSPKSSDFWAARDAQIAPAPDAPPVRIGIWDSGVDLPLFTGRVALDAKGRPLVRGYDEFKRREDMPMAPLPADVQQRRDELNRALDVDGVKNFDVAKLHRPLRR